MSDTVNAAADSGSPAIRMVPPRIADANSPSVRTGVTLDEYAAQKQLPIGLVKVWGLHDGAGLGGRPVVVIPYRDCAGEIVAKRYRCAVAKGGDEDKRFLWRQGDKPLLYGLWRLREWEGEDAITIVEGESDTHTLWSHDEPALGVPGATTWRDEWAEHLQRFRIVYVVLEPDGGGAAMRKWAEASRLRDRIRFVTLGEHKDPSDLHLADPDAFAGKWAAAKNAAQPAQGIASDPALFPSSWRLLDEIELMAVADPEWLIEGVIPRGGLVVLYGPPGSAKTTLVAHTLVCLATGRNWFGHQVKRKGASIYLAAENLSGFKVRLRSAKRAANFNIGEHHGVHTFPEPIDLRDTQQVELFIAFAKASGQSFECVVVDTYAAATQGANENSAEDTTLAVGNARRISRQLNCTIILVHHTNKGGTSERGHGSLRGDADVMMQIVQTDDLYKVETNKVRDGEPMEPLDLRLAKIEAGGVVLKFGSDVAPSENMTDGQIKALRALADAGQELSKTEWQRLAESSVSQATFYRASSELVKRFGFVREQAKHFSITDSGLRALGR